MTPDETHIINQGGDTPRAGWYLIRRVGVRKWTAMFRTGRMRFGRRVEWRGPFGEAIEAIVAGGSGPNVEMFTGNNERAARCSVQASPNPAGQGASPRPAL